MSGKKRKKHDYADRLKYMRLLEEGESFGSIHKEYGINEDLLKVLWKRYETLVSKVQQKVKTEES